MAAAIQEQLLRLQPCREDGTWWEGGFSRPAWTPLGFQRRGDRFFVVCERCGHRGVPDLQALIDAGRGDWPWARFSGKWRCAEAACRSTEVRVEVEQAAAARSAS